MFEMYKDGTLTKNQQTLINKYFTHFYGLVKSLFNEIDTNTNMVKNDYSITKEAFIMCIFVEIIKHIGLDKEMFAKRLVMNHPAEHQAYLELARQIVKEISVQKNYDERNKLTIARAIAYKTAIDEAAVSCSINLKELTDETHYIITRFTKDGEYLPTEKTLKDNYYEIRDILVKYQIDTRPEGFFDFDVDSVREELLDKGFIVEVEEQQ